MLGVSHARNTANYFSRSITLFLFNSSVKRQVLIVLNSLGVYNSYYTVQDSIVDINKDIIVGFKYPIYILPSY